MKGKLRKKTKAKKIGVGRFVKKKMIKIRLQKKKPKPNRIRGRWYA